VRLHRAAAVGGRPSRTTFQPAPRNGVAVTDVQVCNDQVSMFVSSFAKRPTGVRGNDPHVPAVALAHVLLTTADGQVLLRRGRSSRDPEARWSASFEAPLLAGLQTLDMCVRRSAVRALGPSSVDQITLLATGRYHDADTGAPLGVALLCHARSGMTGAELTAQATALGATVTTVPGCDVVQLLAAPPDGRWHPTATSRLSLLAS
jgi:hypothetical protein